VCAFYKRFHGSGDPCHFGCGSAALSFFAAITSVGNSSRLATNLRYSSTKMKGGVEIFEHL